MPKIRPSRDCLKNFSVMRDLKEKPAWCVIGTTPTLPRPKDFAIAFHERLEWAFEKNSV